jgi:hypothetical protein
LADLPLAFRVVYVNIERALDGDVKSVSTPLALAHDLFAAVVSEQAHVRPHALTIAVIATLNDYFEVTGVLLFAVLFFEEFGGKSKMLDGFNNATPIGYFAHGLFILQSSTHKEEEIVSHKKAHKAHKEKK